MSLAKINIKTLEKKSAENDDESFIWQLKCKRFKMELGNTQTEYEIHYL